jgi:ribosomal protein S12 methylthiotransferase
MKVKRSKHRVNVITLGCSKNLVDSEFLMRQLDANGLKVEHDSVVRSGDTVIINTCGFIKDSKEESIDTIMNYIKAKENGIIGKLYVMGCLSERYKKDLEKEIPEVDKYFGVNNIKDIIETIGYDYKIELTGERLISTPNHYAYLKISEGCDRHCSFCAIPGIRGKHISKPLDVLVREAENLVEKGVKELILIAQDLTYYGFDLYRRQALPELLDKLSDINNLNWIRLHYAYPAGFPKELVKIIRNKANVCKYLDIPLQHISNPVLKAMRRSISSQQTYDLISFLRDSIPGLTLRTTLMVGHPGEGEKEFDELMQFVEKTRFDRLGVFAYSEEEETFGAKNLKDSIDEETKTGRADQIMKIQEQISMNLNSLKKGTTLNVLVDRKEDGCWIARTEGDSPEVDDEVLIKSSKPLKIGNFYEVKISGATEHDLIAEI